MQPRLETLAPLAPLPALASALVLALAACDPRVLGGDFLCHPDQPGNCPAGWVCQCRGAACEYRCYPSGGGFCGNGVLDQGEECDGEAFRDACGPGSWCHADCTASCAVCGNDVVEVTPAGAGEQCDEGALNSDDSDATCRPDCRTRRCGDGIIDPISGEECDGPHLGGATCQSAGYYTGTLGCQLDCRLDLTSCAERCGDGIRNGAEACDLFDFGGQTCQDFASPGAGNYHAGHLTCASDCASIDTTHCLGYCGDGARNGAEACDPGDGTLPPDLAGVTCEAFGYYGGSLACAPDCAGFDRAGCAGFCGDGVLDAQEQCDGADVGSLTCQGLGYDAGTVRSSAYCTPVTDSCARFGWRRAVLPATAAALRAAWGSGPADAFVVGTGSYVLHFDGAAWSLMPWLLTGSLTRVWGSGPDDVFAVGAAGFIAHYDGMDWNPMFSGTSQPLSGVWGSGPADVFAVGMGGIIRRYDGADWKAMTSNTTVFLKGVWGSGPTDVFAVGFGGTILHSDGTAWTAMSSGTTQVLQAVWGSGPADVFTVGTGGTILHYDGATWSAMGAGTTDSLMGVWGSGPADLFVVGNNGTALYYNGAAWSPVISGTGDNLNAVWGGGPDNFFAPASSGAIHRFVGHLPRPYGGACAEPLVASCNWAVDSSSVGRPAGPTSYGPSGAPCASGLGGHPVTYRLDVPRVSAVTVRLTPRERDLDLVVLGAFDDHGCDRATCRGTSQNPGLGTEEVTVAPAPYGRSLYLVVDGHGNAGGGYNLTVECARP